MRLVQARAGLSCLLLASTLLGAPLVARAQGGAEIAGDGGRTFGPASSVAHSLDALAFVSIGVGGGSTAPGRDRLNVQGSRWCDAPGCEFWAPVSVPAGALVSRVELEACDTNAFGPIVAVLLRVGKLESGVEELAQASSDANGILPGCAVFGANLATLHTIDNVNNTYRVRVLQDTFTSDLRFQAVRIFYTLQVSPAPATATFGDVPTNHPFFPFIEALAASGITGGCGGGNYCPDNPVTRGQMAKFLSTALGLHFAP